MSSLLVRLGLPLVLASFALVACGEPEAGDGDLGEIEQGLQTFPNQRPAFDFFVGKGLTPAQSAGILGNLSAESGVDPTIRQLGGGPGRGIAQWQVGGRWDTAAAGNVLDFAAGPPARDPLSLAVQLDFIWFELTTIPSYGLTRLRATTTAREATLAFKADYEGCPACSSAKRIEYAEDVLARFGSGSGSSSSGGGSSSSGAPGAPACVVTTTGEEGECLEVSACAELGGVSTPGFCPGSSAVQCCTGVEIEPEPPTGGSSGAGTTSSGGSSRPDAGSGTGEEDPEDGRDPGRIGIAPAEQGCSTSGRSGLQDAGGWLFGLAAVLAGRRARRIKTSGSDCRSRSTR